MSPSFNEDNRTESSVQLLSNSFGFCSECVYVNEQTLELLLRAPLNSLKSSTTGQIDDGRDGHSRRQGSGRPP